MTVREGWPPFETWHRQKKQKREVVNVYVAMERFAQKFSDDMNYVYTTLAKAFRELAEAYQPNNPEVPNMMLQSLEKQIPKRHYFGWHDKCLPRLCTEAARLANNAESEARMQEYLAEREYSDFTPCEYSEEGYAHRPHMYGWADVDYACAGIKDGIPYDAYDANNIIEELEEEGMAYNVFFTNGKMLFDGYTESDAAFTSEYMKRLQEEDEKWVATFSPQGWLLVMACVLAGFILTLFSVYWWARLR